jgi:hypothetical protein
MKVILTPQEREVALFSFSPELSQDEAYRLYKENLIQLLQERRIEVIHRHSCMRRLFNIFRLQLILDLERNLAARLVRVNLGARNLKIILRVKYQFIRRLFTKRRYYV